MAAQALVREDLLANPLRIGMTLGTGVLVGMTGEAAAVVHHGELGVPTIFERRQGDVTPRQLVVAAAAEIGHMAGGAAFAINRSIFAVSVVSPASGVRDGKHDLVASLALRDRCRLGSNVGMADETLCSWR